MIYICCCRAIYWLQNWPVYICGLCEWCEWSVRVWVQHTCDLICWFHESVRVDLSECGLSPTNHSPKIWLRYMFTNSDDEAEKFLSHRARGLRNGRESWCFISQKKPTANSNKFHPSSMEKPVFGFTQLWYTQKPEKQNKCIRPSQPTPRNGSFYWGNSFQPLRHVICDASCERVCVCVI